MSRVVPVPLAIVGLAMGCNLPPSAPVLELDPPNPTTIQDVKLDFATDSLDPEEDDFEYQITWSRDGTALDTHTGALGIASFETSKGESWAVNVVAIDENGNAGTAATASFTVVNSPPAASVQITPDSGEAGRDDDLKVTVNSHDPDGDTVTWDIQWSVNGTRAPDYDGLNTITSQATNDDELWEAKVTPTDGEEEGEPVVASVLVSNAVPEVVDVDLQPVEPVEGDTMRVTAFGADADGDDVTLTYKWFVNGALVVGEDSPALSSGFFDKHDEIHVVITPDDGFTVGDPVSSATRTVLNTVPSIGYVWVSPDIGNEQTQFSCLTLDWEDADPTDSEQYEYQWYIDGVAAGTDATVDGTVFDKHQVLACSATPLDNDAAGATLTSEPVTVSNSPPWAGFTTITPTEDLTEATVFICVPSGFGDFDPTDTEGWELSWWVNGFDIGVDSSVLDGTSFDKDDEVQCIAIPTDGETTGAPAPSATVTVGNTPPTATDIALSPGVADETSEFTCAASGWSDPDGVDVEAYDLVWYVNDLMVSTSAVLHGSDFNRDDTVYCTATPNDGQATGPVLTSSSVVVDNTAPTLLSAILSPSDPVQTTALTVTPAGYEDVDEDDATYVYRWFIDGVENTDYTDSVLPTSAFTKEQTIYAVVHPHDGTVQGASVTSASVTIDNTIPVISEVTISPTDGTEESAFSCDPAGWSDPDGADSEGYYFRWLVNGGLSVTTQTINGDQFDKNDELSCEATPTDGDGIGLKHTAENTVTIINTVPSVDSTAIQPGTGDITTTFTCMPSGWVDPDPSDSASYTWRWLVDGAPSVTTQTITAPDFDRDQVLTCRATPVDDESQGAAVTSATVTVANAIPTLQFASLAPSGQGFESTVFQLNLLGFDDADGDPEGYTYDWYVDGGIALSGSATLDGTNFDKGDQVSVMVAPWDGREAGQSWSLGPVPILNTPPSVDSVVISPDPGQAGQALTAAGVGFDDIDGDNEDYLWQWFVDGQLISGSITDSLDPSEFSGGQVVTVTATPFDGEASGTPVTSQSVTIQDPTCFSLEFDGVDDAVRVIALADFPWVRPFTIETWAYWYDNGTQDIEPLLSQWNNGDPSGLQVSVVGRDHTDPVCGPVFAGEILVRLADTMCMTSSEALTADAWTHIAVVALPTQVRIFIDGSTAGGMPNSDVPSSSADLRFGEQDGAAFGGQISVTRLSSVPRYTTSFSPPTTLDVDEDTIAGWDFLEGSGAWIRDSVDAAHGLIDGAMWVELQVCDFSSP